MSPKFHPYIGGGIAFVGGGFERRSSIGGGDNKDSTTGLWIGTGAYWNLNQNINLGFDLRYTDAEISLFNTDIDAGGTHASITLGYNW